MTYFMRMLLTAVLVVFLSATFSDARAQTPPPTNPSVGTCTNTADYQIAYPHDPNTANPPQGIFSEIKSQIDDAIYLIPEQIFGAIVGSANIVAALKAIVTLYIVIFGIAFTFGMVQITAYEFMIRMAKIGVIVTLLSPTAYNVYNQIFGVFFFDGVDQIINKVTSVILGGFTYYNPVTTFGKGNSGTYVAGGGPFDPMDNAIVMLVSPKMAAILLATFFTGPYGALIGIILLMSLASFLKSLMNAMWVYIMALVLRTFLFGLAPIFLPCILFSRTKNLFDGWLNQLINTCLQPIFLFSFFSFFAILFQACLDQVFQIPACWTQLTGLDIANTQSSPSGVDNQMWRFMLKDCTDYSKWVTYGGKWDMYGPVGINCEQPIHPLGVTLPITLWLIADLASRFNDTVVQIAKDIASASTDLRMGAEKIGDWLGGGGGQASAAKAPVKAGSNAAGMRKNPDGSVAATTPDRKEQLKNANASYQDLVGPRKNPTS